MSQNEKEKSFRNIQTLISEDRATKLCLTGEWISDNDILDRIHEKSKQIQGEFSEWPTSPVQPDDKVKVLKEFFQNATKLLEQSVETQIVHQQIDIGAPAEIRVKPGAVFKVKSSALAVGVNALALILAIFSTTAWPLLFSVWVGLSVINLVKILFNGYESLSDPDEKLVFEAIFRCQGRLCVINFEALRKKSYDEAFGTVNPSVAEIEKEIGGALTNRQIVKTLASLKSRGVLAERNGVWAIVF